MANKENRERREFVRAVISTKAKITRVDRARVGVAPCLGADFHEEGGLSTRRAGADAESASPPAWAIQIARHLLRIDEKLNQIAEKLESHFPETSSSVLADTVDISGSGIGLVLSEAVETGQVLEISMQLPGFPMGVFEAYGEVVRVSARKGKDKGLFDVALKFLYISEPDREQLIACSFAAQRKVIREANENK